MDRIKGHVCEILSSDTLLIEVEFIGKFNRGQFPDFVKVRFTELSPPYHRDVDLTEVVAVLNRRVLGAYVSAHVGRGDANGVYAGKVTLEGSYFRRKKKFLEPKKKKEAKEKQPNQALQTTPMTRSVFEKTKAFEG